MTNPVQSGDLGALQAQAPFVSTCSAAPTVDARSERAKATFPAEWARMEGLTGKPRHRLRARLKNQADYVHGLSLLPSDAKCGNCKHRINAPLNKPTPACDLDSDFHGYQTVALDHSCPRWVKTTTANTVGTKAEGRSAPKATGETQ